jgi:hypothetical protein
MPRYFFDLRFIDRTDNDSAGTVLPDEVAALIYANRIIGELKEAGGYDEPGLAMIIRKDGHASDIVVPF